MDERNPFLKSETDCAQPDFIVETATDEAGIRAANIQLQSRLIRWVYPSLCVLVIVLGIMLLLLKSWWGAFFIIIGVLCLWVRIVVPKLTVSRQVARFRESYGAEAVPCQLVFWPQGVVIHNLLSGGSIHLRYDIINLIQNSGDYIVISTQQKQIVLIKTRDIESQPDFLPYFLAKCPGVKKKGF